MGKHILIVDDNQILRLLLADCLNEQGEDYRVDTACSGEQALSKMDARNFDLVVSDLCMSGIDGLTLIKCIRERYPGTPVILMTCWQGPEIEAAASHLGVFRNVSKPFTLETFLKVIQEALRSPRPKGI